ncbi:MAG TPA: PAS domain-containing protein [Burkholderiales bacterium]|nr:PAS domain-containing protein [Burkholderiales bacterium]
MSLVDTQQGGIGAADEAGLYRLIADSVPLMIWVARADGGLEYFNQRCYEYSGRSYLELEGWGWRGVIHPEDWERCLATWTNALQSGAPYQVQYRLRRADGVFRWHHGSALPVRDAAGKVVRWFGTCTDVEDQVRDVRRLMDRVVIAQESERRRLAEDLHDLIGQNLTALGIDLTALKQRLEASGAPDGARLDVMRGLVERTIDAIRGVMTDLRPPELEEFGLAPALRWYAAEFTERTGLKASVAWAGERRLPREIELALFRIAQEALTNAAKHSGGTSVQLVLAEAEGRIRLSVEDDGGGFADPVGARSARRGGWGLPTMRERAEAHGGTLRVEFPGRGTRLVVEMPAAGR